MKVALVSDCYLPRLGGIEVQVGDLAHRLLAAGHDVEVFTATVGADGQRGGLIELVDGVPVHRLGLRLPLNLLANPFAAGEVQRRLAGGGFDVVHVHMGVVNPFTIDAARVALRLRLPIAMTWHCLLAWAEPAIRATGAIARWARAGVAMSAVSPVAAAPVRRLADGEPVAVLPNGIDVDRWWNADPYRPAPPPGRDGSVHVVTAMRLVVRKRPLPLLDLFARARRATRVPLRLTILGDGCQRRRVQAKAARLRLDDVVDLPGRVGRPEILARYADAHVYVSPARLESFGIAALEARCAGLPVVALRSNGAAGFVHDGVNGVLADDDAGMSEAIAALAGDRGLRERMFRHNVTVPPCQFEWSAVVAATEAEYARAIGAARIARTQGAGSPARGRSLG